MPLAGTLLHQSADQRRRVKSWCHVVNFFIKCLSLVRRFCDGWKVGTMCGCEILFSVRENGRGNSCNAWNSLQGSCSGEDTSLPVVFPLQEWWIVTCRPTSLRVTLDLPNGWTDDKALSVKQFLTQNSMTELIHSPYSPDLTPCDFFLFPRIKKVLKGKRFADVEEVKKKTTETLKGITLQEFQDCFKKWKTRLDRCIASNGQYFEGDSICNT